MNKNKFPTYIIFIILLAILAGFFDYQPIWSKVVSKIHLPQVFLRDWRLGLDLVGGSILTYNIDLNEVAATDRDSVVNGLRDVIERRVNLFGVTEPQVYTAEAGEDKHLIVELAGIKDINQAIEMIGETPLLDFREVEILPAAATSSAGQFAGEDSNYKFIPTNLTGRYIKSAQVDFDNFGKSVVSISFTDEGAKIFEDLTGRNVGKPLAIFLDNEPIEIPTVQEKISGGNAQISGNFTPASARKLVERFNAGALPAPIELLSQQTIGASLGLDSLQKTIFCGIIGFILVILFIIGFYRGFGLIASLALMIYAVLTLGIFKVIPVTLTLSGIAGFILSIGMAVDANVLIFSRMREELKKGLPKRAAIEEGFRRAWPSIRDSNITTIIIAVILFYFATSFVKGFALTLFIGVLMSMFSAITVSKGLLEMFTKNKEKQK
ncbi:MAG: protein translocase subunit SecD [Candidatus Zambryskibacteria bacterium CG10_big_fil_rev_8_21_14_0_10_42_12]|uniref:Protein translocase subunit SecD n=1 Tax=Candidatus Zambryskibacteria bacterium CG10_big_fil_rev_8_21_14_0_10_42_12 TaxID=1975115 RepID=A0A2H0QSK5_9BACT|nr:MAG: protein translocase subunit SecD [Candidatus Zambryskibacteria bacterium CG10_big_fil_rev_8_21_14_0_10_42_12]